MTGVRIIDPIPTGTVFIAGSLSLDGVALTDGGDDDAGRFDAGRVDAGSNSGTGGNSAGNNSAAGGNSGGGGIVVALGRVAAASVHTVQFKTKIQ